MSGFRALALLLMTLLVGGCGADQPAGPAASPATDPGEPTQAQPKLQTTKLYLGSEVMTAELALSFDQQRTGMMFRTKIDPNGGMLFPLPYTQRASFWMKNCSLPLSAAYIDPEGIIREIHNLEPHNTNAVVAASEDIRFVLEAPRGWFENHHIGPGVAVATERGRLMDTFFPPRRGP